MAEGKGACYLMPLDIVADVYYTYDHYATETDLSFHVSNALNNINNYIRTGETSGIIHNIIAFSLFHFKSLETAMLEVAIHYEMGAKKYAARNWEHILETDCFVDSATRHFFKWLRGDQDEPHDRAFLWNLLGLLWTDKQLAKSKEPTT
jgi:hypothetical protein